MRLPALAISIIVVMARLSSAQSASQICRGTGPTRSSEVSPGGPDGRDEDTTDPAIHYCEPLGLARIYMYPGKMKFVQTPEAVYILDETGPSFHIVWLNATHSEDPDPQYWGHSIGRYARVDRDTLRVEITVDDPGAYTKPFTSTRNFRRSDTGFLRCQWVCSVRDDNEHYAKVGKAGTTRPTTFK